MLSHSNKYATYKYLIQLVSEAIILRKFEEANILDLGVSAL